MFFDFLAPVLDPLIAFLLLAVLGMNILDLHLGLVYFMRNMEVKRFRLVPSTPVLTFNQRLSEHPVLHIGINIPAYNEETVVLETVQKALETPYKYGRKEILVVVDGALDRTMPLLIEKYQMVIDFNQEPVYDSVPSEPAKAILVSTLYPNLRLISKENAGKHDTLNVGLKYFSRDIEAVLNMDADTLLGEKSLNALAEKFLSHPDAAAIAGVIIPTYKPDKGNSNKSFLYERSIVGLQLLEYLPAFHISRGGHSVKNSLMIISGAFGLFKRGYLLEIGGYRKGLGEDMDLTLRLQEHFWATKRGEILFEPKAVCYTAAPYSLKDLSTQRTRWFKGLLECLLNFKRLLRFNFFGIIFLEYIIIEVIMALLIPTGILLVFVRPEMVTNQIFLTSLLGIFGLNVLKIVMSFGIESRYRKVNWWALLLIPVQLLLLPVTSFWKLKGIYTFQNKAWGTLTKRF